MIHYHVWFDLRPTLEEERGLRVVRRFLDGLCRAAEATKFQLLRNRGNAPRSQLAKFHALIEFADPNKLSLAMQNQFSRGIHKGLHGEVIEVVMNFHVEIFEEIEPAAGSPAEPPYGCEI